MYHRDARLAQYSKINVIQCINRIKKQKPCNILNRFREALDKIKQLFIKKKKKLSVKESTRDFLNLKKEYP